MKPDEIRKLSKGDVQKKLQGFREELFNLRFQHSTGQLENTQRIPRVKKSIARILTILKEKEAGAGHE